MTTGTSFAAALRPRLRPRRGLAWPKALALGAALLALAACDDPKERVAAHQAAGLAYVEAGEPAKALIEFEAAIQIDPNFAPATYETGRIFEAQGDFRAALGRYERTVVLDPSNLDARLRLGNFRLAAGDAAAAAAEAEAVLAAEPKNAAALALAAGAALRLDEIDKARRLIDEARAIDPTALPGLAADIGHLIRTGRDAEALVRLDEAIALHPGELSLQALKLSLIEKAGDQAAIGAQLRAMTEAFPNETKLREALTDWAVRNGDMATAEAELRALAEAEPDNAVRVADLVKLLLASEGVEAARAEFKTRLAAAPQRGDLRLLLAEFELQAGSRERAEAALRQLADEGGATATTARTRLARILLEEGDVAGADAEIAAAIAAAPEDLEARKLRIARLIDKGEIDPAIADIRSAIEEAPEDPELLRLDARAQELSGNVDLANDRHARAVRAAEYAAASVERYVEFLRRTNRLSGAEAVLSEAVRRHPGDAGMLALLAATRLDLADWAGAERAIEALGKADPGRARALEAEALLRQRRFDESGALLRGAADGSVEKIVQSYLGAGQQTEAAAFLDELIAKEPGNLQAVGLRGALHEAMGEPEAAEARYREILAADPANPAARVALAGLASRRDGLAAGEAEIRAGLEAAPGNLMLLSQLAQYRQTQGDVDGAIAIYEEIYGRAPDALFVANNLASLLSDHRADDPEALRRAYAIAGRLETATIPAWRDTYAWTRHLRGEHARARDVILPVAEALPNDPWVRYHAGMILLALEQKAAAREHLEAALQAAGQAPFAPRAAIEAKLAEIGG